MPRTGFFPIIFASAKTSRNVHKAFNTIGTVRTNSDLYIDNDTLNEFFGEIKPGYVKIPRDRRAPRFYGMTQGEIFPKEFIIFVKDPRDVTRAHDAFIENRLRERFPLEGVPIKLIYRRPKTKDRRLKNKREDG